MTQPAHSEKRRRVSQLRLQLVTEPAKVKCPEPLGIGVRTSASYCFVLAGRDPAQGVIVTIPKHAGPATLTFNLHNRHTYSEEDIRAGRAFAQYRAQVLAC